MEIKNKIVNSYKWLFLLNVLHVTLFTIGQCCEPIREPLCRTGIPYKTTVFPNLVGHSFQGGAAVAVQAFEKLIEKKCSPYIREFVCRVYMPECSSTGKPVAPSWEMCQEVYRECQSFLKQFDFSWPFSLNCSKFEQSTIDKLKTIANDSSEFWFGTGVKALCSVSRPTVACSINSRPNNNDSIVSRFGGKFDVSTVDRLMQIKYDYDHDYVTSCNNNFSMPSGSFEVDPLSPTVHRPWEVRKLPIIQWTSEPSDLYTLVMYDIGYRALHALYVNIKGSNFSTADIVHKYNGPNNPTVVANPYVFLLYKQNGHMPLSNETRLELDSRNFSHIQMNSHINDLKSISWMKIVEDPYSIQSLKDMHFLNNCPLLVTQAMKHQDRPFLPPDISLNMSLNITYTSAAITFTSCCKTYKYNDASLEVNPLGNMTVKTAHVRSAVTPTVTFSKQGLYSKALNFSDEALYTLMMVDPDAFSSGNNSHPHLHWMVMNIAHRNVYEGVTVREYRGPQPPNGTHTYYFLLYLQNSTIDATDIRRYTSQSCTRCYFDITRFTTDEGMELTGASWFITEYDEYVRHIKVDESAKDEATECANQPEYTMCSTGNVQEVFG